MILTKDLETSLKVVERNGHIIDPGLDLDRDPEQEDTEIDLKRGILEREKRGDNLPRFIKCI